MNRLVYFLSYLLRSFHLHGIHSPFVFNLTKDVLRQKEKYYAYDEIESIRAKLLLTQMKIRVEDHGAVKRSSYEKSISSICKNSSQKKRFAQMIFRLARERKAMSILELGTSLGITTAYLAKACPKANLISIEGSSELSKVAKINLDKLELNHVKLINGTFEDELENALKELKKVDLVYFDGNHDQSATIEYFNKALTYSHSKSLFIFDDIYWSTGMKKAWEEIKKNEKVRCTIDLFQLGLVYFDEELTQKHHTVYHSANFFQS